MKKFLSKVIAFLVLRVFFCSVSVCADSGAERALYVNRQWYKLHSKHQAQIELKSREFDKKFPNKLAEYDALVEKIRLASAVFQNEAHAEQAQEKRRLIEEKKSLESLLIPEFEKALREISELNAQSEIAYTEALQSVLKKLNGKKGRANGIKNWHPNWYYLSPALDLTDIVMDEIETRRWDRKIALESVPIRKVYYADKTRIANRFSPDDPNAPGFLTNFFRACSIIGASVSADLIAELAESGYQAVRADLDLTESVSAEMLKLSSGN